MSSAADWFHPGFSPESSLMFCLWQVFWLVLHPFTFPLSQWF
jgi:hypothetical protein